MGKFKIGLLVWAKMKSFPAWPGKIIEPEAGKKEKKKHHFVFFFGSENYAWVPDENIFPYADNRDKFVPAKRIPNGFKEAVDAIEDALKKNPENARMATDNEVSSTTKPEPKLSKATPKTTITVQISSDAKDQSSSPEEPEISLKLRQKIYKKKSVKNENKPKQRSEEEFDKMKETDAQELLLNSPQSVANETANNEIQFEAFSDNDLALFNPEKKKEKVDGELPDKKKERPKSIIGRPKKRAGSPVLTSPATAPKKGKINKDSNQKDATKTKTTVSSSPDTSMSQVNYTDFMSSLTAEPKQSRAVSSSHSRIRDASFLPDYTSLMNDIPSKDSIIATPMKIGFLGLGLMGSGMVLNLLRSGHEVTVWNRTPSKCKDFIKDGALKGNSPSDVVQQCDITFSSVSDPAALKDLVFGNCGVLQGITEGKGYVDMSTIDVETAEDVYEAITARGGRFLEAPVIGSKGQASEGSLVILAAGDQTLYQDCYSCFAAMGKKTFFFGETGSASKMKLVLSLLRGTVIAGLAESLALAEKLGLNTDEVMSTLQIDPVACPLIKTHAVDMLNSNYNEPKCKLQIMQKDLRLGVNMSDSVDQPLHVGAAVNELFKKAKAKGYGEHDVTAVFRAADL